MPDQQDDFVNNPFRKLDRNQFPDHFKSEKGRGASPEDQKLFLAAVERLPAGLPHNGRHDRSRQYVHSPQGFKLEELCRLPQMAMKKKRRQIAKAASAEAAAPDKASKASLPEESDEELFAQATRNASPLGGKGRKTPAPRRRIREIRAEQEISLSEYLAAKLEFAVSCSDEYLEGHVVGLDDLIMNRLREGQFSPEDHLDLHGLTAEQAFESLGEFMHQAWFKGFRAVLVVTGRGRNSPAGMGILRQKLPYWLTHEPFKRIVLAFCTARPYDGGPGSVYVLLRKVRKRGPIRWETLAFDTDVF